MQILGDNDRLPVLSHDLERLGVEIAGLSEVTRLDWLWWKAIPTTSQASTDARLREVAAAISN